MYQNDQYLTTYEDLVFMFLHNLDGNNIGQFWWQKTCQFFDVKLSFVINIKCTLFTRVLEIQKMLKKIFMEILHETNLNRITFTLRRNDINPK